MISIMVARFGPDQPLDAQTVARPQGVR